MDFFLSLFSVNEPYSQCGWFLVAEEKGITGMHCLEVWCLTCSQSPKCVKPITHTLKVTIPFTVCCAFVQPCEPCLVVGCPDSCLVFHEVKKQLIVSINRLKKWIHVFFCQFFSLLSMGLIFPLFTPLYVCLNWANKHINKIATYLLLLVP